MKLPLRSFSLSLFNCSKFIKRRARRSRQRSGRPREAQGPGCAVRSRVGKYTKATGGINGACTGIRASNVRQNRSPRSCSGDEPRGLNFVNGGRRGVPVISIFKMSCVPRPAGQSASRSRQVDVCCFGMIFTFAWSQALREQSLRSFMKRRHRSACDGGKCTGCVHERGASFKEFGSVTFACGATRFRFYSETDSPPRTVQMCDTFPRNEW